MVIPCPACGGPLWIRASRIDRDTQLMYGSVRVVGRPRGKLRVEAEFHCQGAGCEVTIKTALPSFIAEVQALIDGQTDPGRPRKVKPKRPKPEAEPEPVGPLPEWPKDDEES